METRCPGAVFLTAAKLRDYQLRFDGYSARWGGAVANIVPTEGSVVWGGLYVLTPEHIEALDGYEGRGIRYDRQTLTVVTADGEKVQAAVYLRSSPQPIGKPTMAYAQAIKDGMVDCGIDTEAEKPLVSL